MQISETMKTYIHYLIHPFQTHEQFLHPDRFSEKLESFSSYQSLTISWVFVVINGIFRIFLLNLTLLFIVNLLNSADSSFQTLLNLGDIPSLYFIVLSSVLDVIFFPLFGFFIIQFWDIIFRIVGNLLHTPGDVIKKSDQIISVYMSANILRLIPVIGAPIKSLAGMILMYAGLRTQLKASPALSVCVILVPLLTMLIVASVFVLLFMLSL